MFIDRVEDLLAQRTAQEQVSIQNKTLLVLFCPGMFKGLTIGSVYVHSMLRTVELCSIKISNHVAHLFLSRPEFKDFAQHLCICCFVFTSCYALPLSCLNKVLKMINAFSLHFHRTINK